MEDLEKRGTTSLLTLPYTDLAAKEKSKFSAVETPTKAIQDKFLLVELPDGWKAEDIPGCVFLGSPDSQMSLVSESRQQSFDISKVETSNVLILVPPRTTDSKAPGYVGFEEEGDSPTKKQKADLISTPSRLLNPGGAGASFLALQPRPLPLFELKQLVPVWNPDKAGSLRGVAVQRLAHTLKMPQSHIRRGLSGKLEAFELEEDKWVMVREAGLRELDQSILETLVEEEDDTDDNSLVVSLHKIIPQIQSRLRSPRSERLLKYALMRFADNDADNKDGSLTLCFRKIARRAAQSMFQKQTTPWERDAFISRWQSLVPGVEKVNVETMLKGLAIVEKHEEDGSPVVVHLAADQLSSDPARYVAALFKVRKEWKMEDLKIYLDYLVEGTGMTEASILLRYTKLTVITDDDGVSGERITLRS